MVKFGTFDSVPVPTNVSRKRSLSAPPFHHLDMRSGLTDAETQTDGANGSVEEEVYQFAEQAPRAEPKHIPSQLSVVPTEYDEVEEVWAVPDIRANGSLSSIAAAASLEEAVVPDSRANLFLSNLPTWLSREELHAYLETTLDAFGKIHSIELKYNSEGKPYAFAHFYTLKSANEALDQLNKDSREGLQGERMIVRKGLVKRTLFLAFPCTAEHAEMMHLFSQFGKVDHFKILRVFETGKSKGSGFLRYSTRDETLLAFQKLQNNPMIKRVEFAEHESDPVKNRHSEREFTPKEKSHSEREFTPKEKSQADGEARDYDPCVVFMGMLPEKTSKAEIRKFVSQLVGLSPVNVKIVTSNIKDKLSFAFVRFEDPESAQRACEALDGQEWEGFVDSGNLKVEIAKGTRRMSLG